MRADDARQLAATLERMKTELGQMRGWLNGQSLERGLQRLPTQAMRAEHQLDEMLLSARKYAERAPEETSPPGHPRPMPEDLKRGI
jgi:hypothetical protein